MPQRIGVWGDSITYGQGDRLGLGWVGRLRNSFPEDVRVYNFGVCGDTSEDLLKRFTFEANSILPDMIVFAVGTNDSKFPAKADRNKILLHNFGENIQELVAQARVFTNNILLIGPTCADENVKKDSGTRYLNEEMEAYSHSLHELSISQNLQFIDLFDALSPGDLVDGIHPNADGYEKLFQRIRSELKIGAK